MATVRFLNPKTLSPPPGYTHVVEATTPGRIVYVAGQLGLDDTGRVVGSPGDFRAQAEQTFANLRDALAEVGATFRDVIKLNNYLVDMEHLPIFREVRDRHLDKTAPPASTTVAISRLARDGALIEIEAIAVLPARAGRAAKPARRRAAPASKARKRLARSKPRTAKRGRPAARKRR
jgi:enamine deaminase RidA (YjgF/YER057c/UK114 family)